MKPHIDETEFGYITIDGKCYEYDVVIRLGGKVKKRKKKLSKRVFGTSHVIARDEAEYIYERGTDQIIIGSGQEGMVELSDEAAEFLEKARCCVKLVPTRDAIEVWNHSEGNTVGLFHVTC
jgi:hypothetical protein